jgi:hypothetical protein
LVARDDEDIGSPVKYHLLFKLVHGPTRGKQLCSSSTRLLAIKILPDLPSLSIFGVAEISFLDHANQAGAKDKTAPEPGRQQRGRESWCDCVASRQGLRYYQAPDHHLRIPAG